MSDTKSCCRCETIKPLSEFALKYPARMVYQSQCRECQKAISREHYLRNKAKIVERSKANRKAVQQRLSAIVQAALADKRCADCGSKDNLTFYANRNYDGACVSSVVNGGLAEATLQASIANSSIVCKACMHTRGGAALKDFWFGSDTREARIAEQAARTDKPTKNDYKRRRTSVAEDLRLSAARKAA